MQDVFRYILHPWINGVALQAGHHGYLAMSEKKTVTGRARGGIERAKSLSPERRSEIAGRGAAAREEYKKLPLAEFGDPNRPLRILETAMPCYVLSDGTRVLTQFGFLQAIGRSPRPAGGTGGLAGFDKLPSFLGASNLKPLITDDLIASSAPIHFRLPTGGRAVGYRAELLPQVCNVYLAGRDQGLLIGRQKDMAARADMLVRGLAETGIVALVDEATGYQQVRSRDALQAFLDRFLRKELAAWVKTFPDEFFYELFRLKKWQWKGTSKRPGVVGTYINDLIYDRLGPGVLAELEKKNPVENGRRKAKHFQWLTEDIGHPALAQHMYATIGFMRSAETWDEFKSTFYRAFPKKGENLALALTLST
jgi:hypothetical protein